DHRHPTAGGLWLDAGVTPENFLEPIVRAGPQLVLIVDAVAFGGLPGACRLLETADLDTGAISTHAGSLQLVHRYLEARSPAGVKVLGIQPERIEPGEGLSPAVAEAVRRVAATLSDLLA
ncbi:MAG: hydrogenase maturation protease, partial [Planctomycetales bacterium]|nr:hydrogenase maturation protease [Planctomycetales bacterium]